MDPADQVWMAKDYLGFLGVLSFGIFICALALLLIEVIPFFNEVKRAPTRNIGLRGPGMAISLILGVVFPFIALKTGGLGIIELLMPGAGGPPDFVQGRAPFHMTYANISMGLVIALNLLGILGFLLFFFTDGKKHGLTPATWVLPSPIPTNSASSWWARPSLWPLLWWLSAGVCFN